MNDFEVRSVEIMADYAKAFNYISDCEKLPEWTNAFQSVSNNKAIMHTPSGSVEVELVVSASLKQGTIDWFMEFPDGARASAYSRLIRLDEKRNVYSFILTAPPVPLEQMEGALDQQSQILEEELERLRHLMELEG
jgi:hypothetical protein